MNLKDNMRNLLLREQSRCPEAKIQDYYKVIFQSVFGAGHLIKNEESVLNYLREEWSLIDANPAIEFSYDITLTIPIVRLNLARCKAENISLVEIAKVFIEGVNQFVNPLHSKFAQILKITKEILTEDPFCFQQQELSEELPLNQQTNFPIMHHSKIYRDNYHPHYRVMIQSNWEALRLKLDAKTD